MGISSGEDPMIVSHIESYWHSASVWQTDRRTDGRICYSK